MVANASSAPERIRALFYLARFRHDLDAREAAAELASEWKGNDLFNRVISEIREELTKPSTNLGPVVSTPDPDIRKYLEILLAAYDETCPKSGVRS